MLLNWKRNWNLHTYTIESVNIFEVFSFSCFRSMVLVERTVFLAIFTMSELDFHT